MISRMFGEDVDKALMAHPTIEHPASVFMSNLLGGINLQEGTSIKDQNEEVLREGSPRKLQSRKCSLLEYQLLKETQNYIA